jgi:hypothetical protein
MVTATIRESLSVDKPGGLVITRAADHGWSAIILTAATTTLLVTTRVNPLFIMAGSGLLGGLGLVK